MASSDDHHDSDLADPEQIMNVLLDACIKRMSAERGAVFLVDEAGSPQFIPVGFRGHQGDALVRRIDELLQGILIHRDGRVMVGDPSEPGSPAESTSVKGMRTMVLAPVPSGEDILGVVYLDASLADRMFTYGDLNGLEDLCAEAGEALRNYALLQ